MSSKIWLSKPHFNTTNLDFLKETFNSNWISTTGPNIDEFEKSIENILGNDLKVVALNSGTSAIHLALKLLNVGIGDEVICQTFTFCATVNPILYCGAIPIFIDSEKDTWNMCPVYLEKAIQNRLKVNKKPKAIIVVDSYGMPAKWDELLEISKKYKIPIIEDSAEALGAFYKNKMCGTFGKYSIFSFNGNKIITTSAGGVLICNNTKDKAKAIHLATQAKGIGHFQYNEIGYNYRMSNVLAALGLEQLKSLKEKIKQRRLNHIRYKSIISSVRGVALKEEFDEKIVSNFWLNCIVVNNSKFSNIDFLNAFTENNIDVRTLWYPLHMQSYLKKYLFFGDSVAEVLFRKGLCLPSSSSLTEKDFLRIEKIFNLFK
ncbi:DegT/DnrJ/EryC1/StrS family aminotransferase [uncultured Polaribacter sp.]|uniref:DegT/DnrJ/EryC1/StrS family aminotransferase n=1 Tax=uncultured Polaribacter sp. TaxID=174711 RepID=UPI00259BB69B|nr:DegT/DnrJ/EryC1/StrS family aminotransferase [uncultured Polaribacter sp.]